MALAGSILEFAGSDSIYQYVEDAGAQTWTQQGTLAALPDSILTGFTTGSVIPGENDAIAESGIVTPNETNTNNENAVVWASTALSEQATSPPTITSAATVSFTEMQAGSFQVTASGSPTPQIWESGFLPQGVTFNAGVLSGTPAQGTYGTYNEIIFTASNGVGTPATQSFTLMVKSDAPPLVGFNVTNQNPSEGSFTQLPAEGPQQGCPNPLGGCYPEGTVVTLTATPNTGFVFGSWTGFPGCGANPVCVVTMGTQAVVLTLSFAPASVPTPASVSVTPSAQSGTPGTQFSYAVSTAGFSGTPQITATCSIPMGSCAVNGSTLTVTTTAPSASAVPSIRWLLLLGLCAAALFCIPRRRRKTALCVGALAVLAACGRAGSKLATATPPPTTTAGTPAGTYMVQLSAASGSTKATATAQLVIQ
jgi:hypothetical protein